MAEATQVAEERIANIRTVRSFGQENSEFQRYENKIEHVLALGYKEAMARGIFFGLVGVLPLAVINQKFLSLLCLHC